eukprot:g29005.t1
MVPRAAAQEPLSGFLWPHHRCRATRYCSLLTDASDEASACNTWSRTAAENLTVTAALLTSGVSIHVYTLAHSLSWLRKYSDTFLMYLSTPCHGQHPRGLCRLGTVYPFIF